MRQGGLSSPSAKRLMAAPPKTVNRNIQAKRAEFHKPGSGQLSALYP